MDAPTRDDLVSEYLDQLEFDPYPVQEEALLAWFSSEQGVLVCAPTGTGKTVIAEAALYEALRTGRRAYYTTPLIALTEQKFRELQQSAVRWGFSADDVGLVTGNRKVNPDATILVVVAEILLNRLLHPDNFAFEDVFAVVMDEFHSFNDPERGVVWELSLALLPKNVRLLLLSATVGNTAEFLLWLRQRHGRKVDLVQSTDRKVPLEFIWVGNALLSEHIESMIEGTEEARRVPALLFCFNRAECWTVAEQLKGRSLVTADQKSRLSDALEQWDWSDGVGPKLKQILMRGVGVHHAGMLPKYRRRVEDLFQQKLLSVCVCTETLAAGLNLPARSVVLTTLMKGPAGKQKIIDASSAHQMFGRAGRPQFDDRGFVYALAHEDDVRIARWKEQYDQIPEDTKDPNLIKAKKRLKKKMPKRREGVQYWNEEQFRKLIESPPAKLASRGELPYRWLAYLLTLSPEVERLRQFVGKRLLDERQHELAQQQLDRMLRTLWAGGYVELEPETPETWSRSRIDVVSAITQRQEESESSAGSAVAKSAASCVEHEDAFGAGLDVDSPDGTDAGDEAEAEVAPEPVVQGTFGALLSAALEDARTVEAPEEKSSAKHPPEKTPSAVPEQELYKPVRAPANPALDDLLVFRSVNPVYGCFLVDVLGVANREERLQALESVLEFPRSMIAQVRVPGPDVMPPGPLARGWLDEEIIRRGLATVDDLYPKSFDEEDDPQRKFGGPQRRFPIPLAEKLRMVFDSEFPGISISMTPVWIVGDVMRFGSDFQKYVTSRDLTKQEGLVFRHLLRMILLCREFAQLTPPGTEPGEWQQELEEIAEACKLACTGIDPQSTEEILETVEEEPDLKTLAHEADL